MNEFESTLEGINYLSNIIILVFCIWAVLDKRVQTHLKGTLVLGFVAIVAGLNIAKPGALGLLPHHFQVILNMGIAGALVWFYFHWRSKYLTSRRRRSTDWRSK